MTLNEAKEMVASRLRSWCDGGAEDDCIDGYIIAGIIKEGDKKVMKQAFRFYKKKMKIEELKYQHPKRIKVGEYGNTHEKMKDNKSEDRFIYDDRIFQEKEEDKTGWYEMPESWPPPYKSIKMKDNKQEIEKAKKFIEMKLEAKFYCFDSSARAFSLNQVKDWMAEYAESQTLQLRGENEKLVKWVAEFGSLSTKEVLDQLKKEKEKEDLSFDDSLKIALDYDPKKQGVKQKK